MLGARLEKYKQFIVVSVIIWQVRSSFNKCWPMFYRFSFAWRPNNTGSISLQLVLQDAIVCCAYYHVRAQQIFVLQKVETTSVFCNMKTNRATSCKEMFPILLGLNKSISSLTRYSAWPRSWVQRVLGTSSSALRAIWEHCDNEDWKCWRVRERDSGGTVHQSTLPGLLPRAGWSVHRCQEKIHHG